MSTNPFPPEAIDDIPCSRVARPELNAGDHTALVAEIDALRAELNTALTKIHHLETALPSSRRIGAALGVLMARQRITLDAAFDVLSTASQHRNRKLRDLAEDVLYTGTLDRATRQPIPSPAVPSELPSSPAGNENRSTR